MKFQLYNFVIEEHEMLMFSLCKYKQKFKVELKMTKRMWLIENSNNDKFSSSSIKCFPVFGVHSVFVCALVCVCVSV